MKAITLLLGLGLMVMIPASNSLAFYDDLLWDAHSHVDIGSGGNPTKAVNIADAINVTQDLPGVERIMLFPKRHLDSYMLNTLAEDRLLHNRLITAIGFQNDPSAEGANDGWRSYVSSETDPENPQDKRYNPAEDAFLNKVEACAAGGSYQWLGEVALYGKEGQNKDDIKADLFKPDIKDRILRVLRIAARYDLPVTIHHTVTDTAGNLICDLENLPTNPEECPETARERFLSILRTHANEVINDPDIDDPATVIWAHWGGLSNPGAIPDMIDEFDNLHFDLAWFHKGLAPGQNPLFDPGNPDDPDNRRCNIDNLDLCEFTHDWKALLNSNPGRFLAGVDAATNSDYRDRYQVRERILRTALGTLDAANATNAQLIAAGNLQQLLSVVPSPAADGDINLDCMVNAGDVVLGLQVLSGSATLSPLKLVHGDVAPLASGVPAPDDLFTLGDLQVILHKVLGLINF